MENIQEKLQENKAEYTVEYVLRQLAMLREDDTALMESLAVLRDMPDGDSGEPYAPGNVQGKAKAEAIRDIFRTREETNRALLAFYHQIYNDLTSHNAPASKE